MEFFILHDGAKQGPFDLIAMIKKVKNGSLTAATLVADNAEGPFIEAAQLPAVSIIITEHANPTAGEAKTGNIQMTLKACFIEGIELWIRHILDYSLFASVIVAAGFGIRSALANIVPGILPAYLGTVLAMALFFGFCYYVLETKRSQRISVSEFIGVFKRTIIPFFAASVVLSIFVVGYKMGSQVGLVSTLIALVVMTFIIFMPFLATDSEMGVFKAAKLSAQKVKNIGSDNFGVILAIVSINLFAALLPALLMPNLLGLGLFISIPVTISALANIYDQIFV